MKKQSKKLTEKEAEVMERFWSEGPQTIMELLATYPDPKSRPLVEDEKISVDELREIIDMVESRNKK